MNNLTDREKEILEILDDFELTLNQRAGKIKKLLQLEEITLPVKGIKVELTGKQHKKKYTGYIVYIDPEYVWLAVGQDYPPDEGYRFKIKNYTWHYPETIREYKYKDLEAVYQMKGNQVSVPKKLFKYARETTNTPVKDYEKELIEGMPCLWKHRYQDIWEVGILREHHLHHNYYLVNDDNTVEYAIPFDRSKIGKVEG